MTEHYYSENPQCEKKFFNIRKRVNNIDLDLITAKGVYSPLQLDRGSLFHIKVIKIKSKDKVLDLGCGYGTVGILLAKMYKDINLYMTDINQRAIECLKENLKRNKVNAVIHQGDGFENIPDKDFDTIIFNPPIHAGLKVCYKLFAEAFEHLKEGGTLQVVLRPKIGGKRLLKKIEEIFGNVEKVGKEGIYAAFIAIKRKNNTENL